MNEKGANKTDYIEEEETWTKTMDLRYIEIDTFLRRLQQKHISNLGNEKWVDIETVVL